MERIGEVNFLALFQTTIKELEREKKEFKKHASKQRSRIASLEKVNGYLELENEQLEEVVSNYEYTINKNKSQKDTLTKLKIELLKHEKKNQLLWWIGCVGSIIGVVCWWFCCSDLHPKTFPTKYE